MSDSLFPGAAATQSTQISPGNVDEVGTSLRRVRFMPEDLSTCPAEPNLAGSSSNLLGAKLMCAQINSLMKCDVDGIARLRAEFASHSATLAALESSHEGAATQEIDQARRLMALYSLRLDAQQERIDSLQHLQRRISNNELNISECIAELKSMPNPIGELGMTIQSIKG